MSNPMSNPMSNQAISTTVSMINFEENYKNRLNKITNEITKQQNKLNKLTLELNELTDTLLEPSDKSWFSLTKSTKSDESNQLKTDIKNLKLVIAKEKTSLTTLQKQLTHLQKNPIRDKSFYNNNVIYISPELHKKLNNTKYIIIRRPNFTTIYPVISLNFITNTIFCNKIIRLHIGKNVEIKQLINKLNYDELCDVTIKVFSIDFIKRKTNHFNNITSDDIIKHFMNKHIINQQMILCKIPHYVDGKLVSNGYVKVSFNTGSNTISGYMSDKTNMTIFKDDVILKLIQNQLQPNKFKLSKETLSDYGIGGLRNQIKSIQDSVIGPRSTSDKIKDILGIEYCTGIILHGPPGTGKTLIGKNIGKFLNIDDENITFVSGPELLSRFVGEAEENIRKLFQPAEENPDTQYLIIFDEIDSLFRKRGNSSNSHGDKLVNQLLSKMDGENKLENLLIIGTTNRLDLIDEALLRYGRFSLQLHVGIPTFDERVSIINIHTKNLASNNALTKSFDAKQLAKLTPNYTGAEIKGFIESAKTIALAEYDEEEEKDEMDEMDKDIKVTMAHFTKAISTMRISHQTIINPQNIDLPQSQKEVVQRVLHSVMGKNKDNDKFINKIIITSENKSSLSKHIAHQLKYDLVEIIDPKRIMNLDASGIAKLINEVFNKCTQVDEAILILDDIDILVQYMKVGCAYSNNTLQQILKICRSKHYDNKIVVMITSSDHFYERFELSELVGGFFI